MPILFSLVERTPNRLRYLCTTSGNTTNPNSGILVNRNSTTPDLRGDASLFRGFPLSNLVSTTVADQAAARKLMFGDTLTTKLDLEIQRAHVEIYARTTDTSGSWWSVDATRGDLVDAQSGAFPVLTLQAPTQTGQTGYLEISFEHTYDR